MSHSDTSIMHSVITLVACIFLFNSPIHAEPPGASKPPRNETNLDRLKKDLLMNYDKYARPQEYYNSTELRIGLAINQLETNELKSTITAHVIVRLIWMDSKLTWNESNYGGLNVARIADHEIWQADLYLYNSISGGEPITRFNNPNVLVYSNGEVLSVPPAKLTALCQFDLRHWPFDTQNCRFTIGSWTHNGNEIKLKLYNNNTHVDLESQLGWSAWTVLHSVAEIETNYYDCCQEPYYLAHFDVTISRKYGSYKAVVVTPAIALALLILMQLWLPPQSEERLILSGFFAVTLVMFLIYFSSKVSPAASTPLLVMFYAGSLCMVCLSMVANAAALALARIKPTQTLPWALRNHLNGVAGKVLMLDLNFDHVEIMTESTKNPSIRSNEMFGFGSDCFTITRFMSQKRRRQDLILAVAADRMLFIVYSVAYAILLAVYLC